MFEAFTCKLSEASCYTAILSWEAVSTFLYYVPFAFGTFLVLWVWKKDFFMPSRINKKFPPRSRIINEIKYSFVTLFIFIAQGSMVFVAAKLGWLQISLELSDFSVSYLLFSLLVLIVWHETYFYWLHRAIHFKKLFKYVHRVHHMSNNTSPLAAYSFHPIEAFLELMYMPIFLLLIPTHPIVVIGHSVATMFMNVLWHSGHEFFPKGFVRGKLTGWINTSTHHNMHHSHVTCNYSLYLNFWDRICGTNHPKYVEYFEEVVARREQASSGQPEGQGVLSGN